MIDHISFNVPPSRYQEIVTFYLAALAPLGYTKQMDISGIACGIGDSPSNARFWLGQFEDIAKHITGIFHLAFMAKSRDVVDRFHQEAIKAGGKDNGEPGIRSKYHANYYAAFVVDPLGNNIEVVIHTPE
ncbi:glyoxalase/bleomycin resistance protein/dioxygenase [Massarina eburnea CBS 473.64]|uniref:Glyoxalase/bleomycin resistance protein/dioxygenase n=1 Tax=Massarina eburnea CBS 473.64 TaxID=1395130 RepID=A0A6A6RWS8_9PLEO|nr:glyoxalase/bleomycin resistance protein/dioxygenase [Massarina eburnea CBS 473.64]